MSESDIERMSPFEFSLRSEAYREKLSEIWMPYGMVCSVIANTVGGLTGNSPGKTPYDFIPEYLIPSDYDTNEHGLSSGKEIPVEEFKRLAEKMK